MNYRCAVMAGFIMMLAGCQASHVSSPVVSAASQPADADLSMPTSFKLIDVSSVPGRGLVETRDPRPIRVQIAHLEIYQLTVPYGTLSHNESFWKHVDETAVDVPTYEMLYKNGIRVGVAPIGEWPYFRDLITRNPATSTRSILTAKEVSGAELTAQKEVDSQDIFYFDTLNHLTGRSFDRSENFWSVSFQPVPHRSNALRIALCPVVRTMRAVLKVVGTQEYQVKQVRPERLYDLNLRADVSPGYFLIVGLSTEGQWPTSLGNRFLVQDGASERFEQVLLFVPQVVEGVNPS